MTTVSIARTTFGDFTTGRDLPIRAALTLAWCLMTTMLGTGCANAEFVVARDGHFVLNGRRHAFVGVNFWQGMHMAMAAPWGDRARLEAELDRLAALGVSNLRVLAGAEGPDTEPYRIGPAMMTSPGEYDEQVLDGLDYLLAQIASRKMHAVVVLTNFWEWSGGMAQYVAWAEHTAIPYPETNDWHLFCDYTKTFYANPTCQTWYRNHIKRIVTRTNPYTHRAYRNEPAIFAWELANEPRYYPMEWIERTAAYIKTLDTSHMVTTGSEGAVGGPFTPTHCADHIDYATIHIWPQTWGWLDPSQPATLETGIAKSLEYLSEHLSQATALGKPLVVEEFGMPRDLEPLGDIYNPASTTTWRDKLFAAVYAAIEASCSSGGAASGSNVWGWSGATRPGDRWISDPPHEKPGWYAVYDRDRSTLALIASHARKIRYVVADR